MPEELKIIWILAVGLGLACASGYITMRIGLSPILGYLLAGYLIGPNSPGYIADQHISDQLANIGVTLLMFAVGLNFNWKEISPFKNIVVTGGIILSSICIFSGIILGIFVGSGATVGFVIGIAVCVSSTVVIVLVLTDQNLIHTKQGNIVVGWTIVEDLISVLGLILLPALVVNTLDTSQSTSTVIIYSILFILLKVISLGMLIYFIGEPLIEKILKIIARTRSHELFTLAILALVFLIAVGCSYYFGISIALGAFIAGTIIGKTKMSHQAAANALPMRDAFSVVFFLSVGMLFNPFMIQNNLPLFLGILMIIMILRPIATFLIVKIAQYPSYIAFTVAISVTQIGEYSFIMAEQASQLGLLHDNSYDMIIASAFISIAINPILFQIFKPLTVKKKQSETSSNIGGNHLNLSGKSSKQRVLVVGYGPVGRAVAIHLAKSRHVIVINQNIDTISSSRNKNIEIIYGDATQMHILERIDMENINLIVITTPNMHITRAIIEVSHLINPNIKIVARIHFKSEKENTQLENIAVICDEEATSEKMIATLSILNT